MNQRVKGKVAVVTGAARGIGRACAKLLAAEGAAVAVTDLLDEEGQSLVDEICQAGGTAGYWHLDVTNEQQVFEVMRMIRSKFGPITVLVNNAGIGASKKPPCEMSAAEWDEVLSVNVKGVFLCNKYVVPQMVSNKKGSVINLSSICGLVGGAETSCCHASKGAIRLMTKSDSITYAPNGVRVNSINPGYIKTTMVDEIVCAQGGDQETSLQLLRDMHPLGCLGEPEDVAYGVLYLASDESRFVTGTELVIDGGIAAR